MPFFLSLALTGLLEGAKEPPNIPLFGQNKERIHISMKTNWPLLLRIRSAFFFSGHKPIFGTGIEFLSLGASEITGAHYLYHDVSGSGLGDCLTSTSSNRSTMPSDPSI